MREIAKAQRLLLWSIVVSLLGLLPRVGVVLMVLSVPLQLYCVYRLGTALRIRLMWLWLLAMFVPVLSLILLVVLSQKATNVIQAAGFKVGLMGAKIDRTEPVNVEGPP